MGYYGQPPPGAPAAANLKMSHLLSKYGGPVFTQAVRNLPQPEAARWRCASLAPGLLPADRTGIAA